MKSTLIIVAYIYFKITKEKNVVFNLLNDTVILGVAIFFIALAFLWLSVNYIQKSNLSSRFSRILIYIAIALMFAIIIYIFDNHSSSYLANYN